jgi:dienelactone hydrolase
LLLPSILALSGLSAVAQEVESVDVSSAGLVARLHRPAAPGPHPAVLVLGGSGGGIGWQDETAALLAERGFVALALAYFGMEGLPAELERIPLEYVEHGLSYLRLQGDVDSLRVGVAGVSKGGELALLVASMHEEIRAVAVFVPSGIVFQSIAEGFPRTSSWSHGGGEVPFVPYGSVESASALADYYVAGIEQADSATLAAATIPVERIAGPIFLLSGRDDNLWPSTLLSERVIERLEANDFAHPHEHVAYGDAGHLISSVREEDVSRRGGTEAGNRRAQVDARERFLEFFERHLGQSP